MLADAHAVETTRGSSSQIRGNQRGRLSIADFNQEKETNLKYLDHLMSLFDRLIIEVDTPTYQIGLLSRHRIRSHVYTARSGEIDQLNYIHGTAVINHVLKAPNSTSGDRVTSADRQERDIAERKRRRDDYESSDHVSDTRRVFTKRNRDTSRGTNSIREKLNLWFYDARHIHPEVLRSKLCPFLGPEAHSRPFVYNV